MTVDSWQSFASEVVADCRIFKVKRHRRERVSEDRSRAGQRHDFFVLDSPDWVNVVAITSRGEVVLVEQFRHGTDTVTIEVPSGLVDPGEDPLTAAKRELAEETGYVSDRWVHLGTTDPNPAFLGNKLDTYLAINARHEVETDFDAHEDIAVRTAPFVETLAMIDRGEIGHSLAIVALHRALRYRHR